MNDIFLSPRRSSAHDKKELSEKYVEVNAINLYKEKDIKALDELFQEVGVYRQGKDYKGLLEFIKNFPKIAPFNAFLLHVQKPGSQYVASVSEWKKRFKRTIKPGARALVILWPFAPVRFVFELGDTEGKEPFPESLLKPFLTDGKISNQVFQRLLRNLPRDGISYHEADHGTASAGFITVTGGNGVQAIGKNQTRVLYHLVVNRNHSNEEKFATISHELGHLYCGHLGSPNENWWPNRKDLNKYVREFEAESVAWLICERAKIKNPSAQYLNDYLGEDGQIPPISLETVLKAAGMIESMTFRPLGLRKEILANSQ